MKLYHRIITLLSLAVLTIFGLGNAVKAEGKYPNRPITLVVSFPAGGKADLVARINAEALSAQLGVPVTVLNISGGGMIPAVMHVLQAPADGYTLFRWTTPSIVIGPLVRPTPFDPQKALTPLLSDESISNVLYVSAKSPIKTFEQFIAAAKEKKLIMGVNAIGAPPDLSAVQLAQQFNLKFTYLPLKTVPASMLSLIGGQVDAAVGQTTSMREFGNKIRPLVILDNNRQPSFGADLPGVRTVGEVFPGKAALTWIRAGLGVKAGTPKAIVERLETAAVAAMDNKIYAAKINKISEYNWVGGTKATAALIQQGIGFYKPLLASLNLLKK